MQIQSFLGVVFPCLNPSSWCWALCLLVAQQSEFCGLVRIACPSLIYSNNKSALVQCILVILEQVFTEYLPGYSPDLLDAVLV